MSNWKDDYIATKFSPDVIPEMKRQYGKLVALHNRDTDKAFLDSEMDFIFNYDVAAKLYAKNNWSVDNEVRAHIDYFSKVGVKDILPSKDSVAKMLYDIAVSSIDPKDKISSLKEYSNVMGFNNSDSNQQGAVQNVVLIRDNGDKLTWEEKIKKQQYDLKAYAEKMVDECE